MTCAVATEEALGIEYDEQTACDVCRDVRIKTKCSYVICGYLLHRRLPEL